MGYILRMSFRFMNVSSRYLILSLIWVAMGGYFVFLAVCTHLLCYDLYFHYILYQTVTKQHTFVELLLTTFIGACEDMIGVRRIQSVKSSMLHFIYRFACRSYFFAYFLYLRMLSKPILKFTKKHSAVLLSCIVLFIYFDFECEICRNYDRRFSNFKENTFGFYLLITVGVFSIIQILFYCVIYCYYIERQNKISMQKEINLPNVNDVKNENAQQSYDTNNNQGNKPTQKKTKQNIPNINEKIAENKMGTDNSDTHMNTFNDNKNSNKNNDKTLHVESKTPVPENPLPNLIDINVSHGL